MLWFELVEKLRCSIVVQIGKPEAFVQWNHHKPERTFWNKKKKLMIYTEFEGVLQWSLLSVCALVYEEAQFSRQLKFRSHINVRARNAIEPTSLNSHGFPAEHIRIISYNFILILYHWYWLHSCKFVFTPSLVFCQQLAMLWCLNVAHRFYNIVTAAVFFS